MLSSFQESSSAGERLIAIAVLNMFPHANHLDRLAERMEPEPEKPFVAYHSAVALLDAVINLPAENCAGLGDALARARELALRLKGDPDRLTVLRRADPELEQKCVKIRIGVLALRPQGNAAKTRLRAIRR